jgi:hypothetical protein
MALDMANSRTAERGRNAGAVTWKTRLPWRLERREEALEGDRGCRFTCLNPKGGLKDSGGRIDGLVEDSKKLSQQIRPNGVDDKTY